MNGKSRNPQKESVKGALGQKEIADMLNGWLPYLSEGFCVCCTDLLKIRIENLASSSESALTMGSPEKNSAVSTSKYSNRNADSKFSPGWGSGCKLSSVTSSSVSENSSRDGFGEVLSAVAGGGAVDDLDVQDGSGLSREQSAQTRLLQVGRKKDFVFIERINGTPVNVLQGLELHTHVFSAAEQKTIVDYVYSLQKKGQKGQLRERTYSEPRKWMRGKGRVTIQFGCCYNYAVDKKGNPPGIIRDEEVDPLPPLFVSIIKRLVGWHVLPRTAVPNSCIVNIYEEGDCIPPHIDHHDFVRPFCTVSFLTECNILFGSNLKIIGPGEFSGPVAIPLPVGSVLILNGNGADVAKHCVPAVPARRISITFRKMDGSKLPYNFSPDSELQGLKPIANNSSTPQSRTPNIHHDNRESDRVAGAISSLRLGEDDFPPLGGGKNSIHRPRNKMDRLKQ